VRTTFAFLASLFWLICPAFAGIVQPEDRVPGHPGITYFDLMRQVVTDLDADPKSTPTAHEIVPYRHIEGANARTDPAGPLEIKYLEPLDIHADGATRLVLMADLGPSDENVAEFVLLALFDTAEKPKLLDVVEVGRDRLIGFGSPALTPLGSGTDLINIDSDHFNSNEDFVNNELVFIRDNRFRLVDSLFTFNFKDCTSVLNEEPTIKTYSDSRRRYRRISVVVAEKQSLQSGATDCDEKPPRPFLRKFHAIYRWDSRYGRFVTVASDMKKLDAVNDRLINRP
jgi:hypothetical protein